MNFLYRDPAELTIHAAIKNQPRLALDHPQMVAWRRGMKRSGADAHEVLITADNQIVDGRHWVWNAKSLEWKKVRVRIVADDEVNAVILETLLNRRHYTKGQLAYIIAPMLDEVFAESQKRRAMNASKNELHSVQFVSETPESIAAGLGVSYRVLMQAREVREFFQTDKKKRTMTDQNDVKENNVTFAEFYEPRILLVEDPESPRTRAYGLGAVLAGIKAVLAMEGKGREHGGGKPESITKQLSLFENSLGDFTAKFSYWKKWEPETRQAAMNSLPPVVEKMPDDLLAEFARVIKTETKRREK